MRKVQFSALTLLSVALMACGSNQTPNAAQQNKSTVNVSQQVGEGFWSTSGSKIIDQNGQVVRMTGINWFGFETANFMPHGLWSVNYKDVLNQVKAMGFTVLRIPFSNEMLSGPKMPSGLNDFANPELKGLNSLQILDKIIEHSGTIGLKIFLDRHRPDSAGQSHLWYTSAYPESKWISDWVFLANRYKGNPTVVGADLHNEPHSVDGAGPNSCWGCGDPAQDWRLAAEKAGNAILAVNPDWLIIVEGNECWASDGSAVKPNQWNPNPNMNCNWWGGNLMGAQTFPVRLTKPNKLVYSSHDYGMSVYNQQPWFTDPSFPATLEPHWDKYWGYLVKNNIAPVIVGEFGSTLQDPKDQVWLPSLLKYLEKIGASWTYWSLNPNSGDTKGILLDDWKTIDTVRYNVVKPYLVPLSGGGTPTNQAPTVAISNPASNTNFASGATITVSATASDSDGTVAKVDLYVDGVLKQTKAAAPYTFSVAGLTNGSHTLKVVATDDKAATSEASVAVSLGTTTGPVTEYCTDFHTIRVGNYIYVNNTWGSAKTNGQPYKQCLQERTVNGVKQYGWNWNWPGYDPTVYAYPEIVYGWKPWDTMTSTDPRFPMKINGMPNVQMTWDVEGTRTGHYDFAPEIWFTSTPGDGAARPQDITTEIMLWLDYDAGTNPAGSKVATSVIDGVTYDVYKARISGGGATWDYLAYKGPAGRNTGSISITKFAQDAVAKGLANGEHYMSGVEFGDESSGGTGNIWVKKYEITVGTANVAPTVAISSPTEGQSFVSGSTVNVTATASDTDGTVSKVDFYVDGVLKLSDTTAPYTYAATGLTAGAHAIRAVATDNGGASSSVTRNITIQANAAPTLSVSTPTEGQNFATGTTVNVSATATDSDGVAKVEFFVDGVLKATSTLAPYSYAATGLTSGAHTVRVVATDTKGAASTVTRNITVGTVNTPPTLSVTSPTEGQSFAAGASINMAATATDSDGVARVDFYIDGVLKLSDTTAPYSYTATGVSSGSHVARVVAVDTKGAVTGINRNFTVQAVVTGTCKVVYTKQNDWGTGATINLDISNTGTTAVNNWTLAFNFSGTEKIRDFWNATITQSGQGVSIKPLSWNSTINPGQTINLGFNMDYTGTSTTPVSFTLNGQTCTK